MKTENNIAILFLRDSPFSKKQAIKMNKKEKSFSLKMTEAKFQKNGKTEKNQKKFELL